jgi:hypothetical protein
MFAFMYFTDRIYESKHNVDENILQLTDDYALISASLMFMVSMTLLVVIFQLM